MTRAPSSARARWFGVVVVLGTVFSLVSSPDSIPTGRATFVANFAKLLPLMFPALSAQSIVSGCTNSDVASGNQITITLTRLAGVTGGTEVLFSNEARSVNLLGAPGTTLSDRFFEGLDGLPDGSYSQLNIRVSTEMTYKGAVTCVIGGETRYYYSNGSATPPSPYVTSSLSAAAALAQSTTVTVSGTSDFPLAVNYTLVTGQPTVVNIAFSPTIAVYDTGGAVYALFPASNATGASAQ